MKGWIVYPRYVSLHCDNAFEWMRSEAHAHGIELEVLFFEELAPLCVPEGDMLLRDGKPVADYPDFVIFRGYDTLLAIHFESRGIPVINSSYAAAAAKDKLLSCQKLAAAGVAIPATVGGAPGEWDYSLLCKLLGGGTFVVKRRDGAKGEDVYLVENETQMREAISNCRENCIAQQFIAPSRGRDVRVWVIGGRAVACVMRYSEDSFRSNYCLGGKVAPYELTSEIRAIAEKSADIIGLEFAGIDLLFDNEGMVVCEINANAGFRTLSQVGGNDIPAQLFSYISAKYGNSISK